MKHDALKDHLFLNSVNRISEAAATVLVALAPSKLCISMLFADTDLSLNHFHHSYKFQVPFNSLLFFIQIIKNIIWVYQVQNPGPLTRQTVYHCSSPQTSFHVYFVESLWLGLCRQLSCTASTRDLSSIFRTTKQSGAWLCMCEGSLLRRLVQGDKMVVLDLPSAEALSIKFLPL